MFALALAFCCGQTGKVGKGNGEWQMENWGNAENGEEAKGEGRGRNRHPGANKNQWQDKSAVMEF